jgi:hypothetical protein
MISSSKDAEKYEISTFISGRKSLQTALLNIDITTKYYHRLNYKSLAALREMLHEQRNQRLIFIVIHENLEQ